MIQIINLAGQRSYALAMPRKPDSNSTEPANWHCIDVPAVLAAVRSDARAGLSREEAAQRLARHGKNDIVEARRRALWQLVLGQFADFMILLLIAAAIISGAAGDPADTITILVIVLLNALTGMVQEFRAERAIASLRQMATPDVTVNRDGGLRKISSRSLVAGDVLLLEEGELVPADARLLEVQGLEVNESALTGESQAVTKTSAAMESADASLGDRHNMVYRGTQVNRGRATAVVVATGMRTELGRIADMLQRQVIVKTPLQLRLARFSRRLALLVVAICAVILVAGLMRGESVLLMFLTAVSLAVAAIPEALPAVVAISLALGAHKMSRRNALIRHLPAVETLGSVTWICADKTGTLTENRMQVETLYLAGETRTDLAGTQRAGELLGQALALNNNIKALDHGDHAPRATGEPTELALFEAAARFGYSKHECETRLPRLGEIPFDSGRKLMTTLHKAPDGIIAFIKGAPEVLVPRCRDRVDGNETVPLDPETCLRAADSLAAQGYRVIALAYREFAEQPDLGDDGALESELTLLGFAGLLDPPRPEARAAVRECIEAGITPVMITGDHPHTAHFIAHRLGIIDGPATVMTGQELASLPDPLLRRRVHDTRVYARVSPEQKTRIVAALQAEGQFVAMTGDGVNDAPALRAADIGVAMGRKGTEVAREASAMVLLDDNFATIVAAVREGRRIFDNILKFIRYTMTSNTGEIAVLFFAPFVGMPIPLLPIHILWINLVTDGLPGLALTAEPAERDIMRRPPRHPQASIFGDGMWQYMLAVGFLIGGLSLLTQAWAYGGRSDNWQTMVFTVLTLSQLVHALTIRSQHESLLTIGFMSNPKLLGVIVFSIALQLTVIYLPACQQIFKTSALTGVELALCCAVSSVVFVAVEGGKWIHRLAHRQPQSI